MGDYSIPQLLALAKSAGFSDQEAPEMAAIAMAESSGRADVVNSIGATGLWQINQPVWAHQYPQWTKAWLKVPANNAAAARTVYQAQGYHAWTVYPTASSKYLPSPSVTNDVLSNVEKWLGAPAKALTGLGGQLLQLPDQVTGFLTALEGPVKAAAWIVNPGSWVRILAGFFGFLLLGAGLFTLAKAT